MTEEMVCCPKCNGLGKVPKKGFRSKIVRSDDPSKKWCYKCKVFKQKEQFYGEKGPYCKECQNFRVKKKYDINCLHCGAKARVTSKKVVFCSIRCAKERHKDERRSRAHQLLPNYLIEDFKG